MTKEYILEHFETWVFLAASSPFHTSADDKLNEAYDTLGNTEYSRLYKNAERNLKQ